MSERTRGMLKSFGVSVTMYEEAMEKLLREGDPQAALAEALRLNLELTARLAEMVKYVAELQQKATEELLKKLK
ncbi:MAG: hypothetical protein QXP98_08085 [Thermoproteus sp.]